MSRWGEGRQPRYGDAMTQKAVRMPRRWLVALDAISAATKSNTNELIRKALVAAYPVLREEQDK